MACDDRQLTEAQRQAGYQNQRTGVQQAVRPFSGRPTLENLIDYINRELQPAVRRTRDAVNDVYLQVADNAPSGNPLAYYFSTETAAADPTVGRIRLDASPQNTATTIRISQTNARLVDVAPWLDVMAGSSTTPLGVVTLSDAINPGRAIRFDLSTMVDQGDYWDLGVSVIEATHPDPFVDGEAVVLAFIPGVASTGTTVPPGALTPIGANTVLGNPTAITAPPTAIAINDPAILGRRGIAGTGNIESIDVPDTSSFTGESVFPRASSLRTFIQWRPITLTDLPLINDNRFVGNISGAVSRPIYTDLGDLSSDSIIYENVGKTFVRETMDGDVFAAQNSNVTLIQPNVVSDTKLRDSGPLSVIGRAANSTGDPGDISAVAASGSVLRESGSTLGFGTIATAGLADDSVTNAKLAEMAANTVKANATSATANPTDFAVGTNTVLGRVAGNIVSAQLVNAQITDATIANAKLANMAAGTVKGRQVDAATGVPVDLTGAEVAELLRLGTVQVETGALPLNITLNADTTYLVIDTSGTGEVQTISGATPGRVLVVANTNFGTKTFIHGGGTGQFICPGLVNLQATVREALILVGDRSLPAWQVFSITRVGIGLTDGDKGDITVSSTGTVWTIDNDVVSNAKLRNSAALSVIGRSVNSTGDPGDIATTSGSNGVLVESGGTLSFGLVTTNNILDNTIANADLRQSAALSVVGRTFNTIGNVADISAVAGSDAVLRESGSNIAFGQIATAGIADDAVTNGKLRNGAALTVIGRSANSTGDVADIAAGSDGHVLRRSGTTLGFGTIATAGITDAAVTLAKQADLAQSRIIGRAEGAGTGVPTALTPTQVVSIIDGETVTWTGSHTFNGTNLTVTAGADVAITASGGTVTLAATTQVQITSPTRLASSISLDSVTTTATTAANNLAIGSVNVVRFTGPPSPLTGMVPVVDGQTVMLVNAHASTDMVILLEATGSSSAANCFAGSVTDRHIKPGEMALAWYDGASDRWRLLCRDEVDL